VVFFTNPEDVKSIYGSVHSREHVNIESQENIDEKYVYAELQHSPMKNIDPPSSTRQNSKEEFKFEKIISVKFIILIS